MVDVQSDSQPQCVTALVTVVMASLTGTLRYGSPPTGPAVARDSPSGDGNMIADKLQATSSVSLEAIRAVGNPSDAMRVLKRQLDALLVELHQLCDGTGRARVQLYSDEPPALLLERWRKISNDFYKEKQKVFSISCIPDIYDMAK